MLFLPHHNHVGTNKYRVYSSHDSLSWGFLECSSLSAGLSSTLQPPDMTQKVPACPTQLTQLVFVWFPEVFFLFFPFKTYLLQCHAHFSFSLLRRDPFPFLTQPLQGGGDLAVSLLLSSSNKGIKSLPLSFSPSIAIQFLLRTEQCTCLFAFELQQF